MGVIKASKNYGYVKYPGFTSLDGKELGLNYKKLR
jgi:hypothetical protein